VNTLLYTSALGLFCMIAEVFNLRKIMIPAILAALTAIFYVNMNNWNHTGDVVIYGINMSHMITVDHFSVAFSGLSILLAAFIFILSHDYYKNEQHHLSDYLSILLFILCGALALFSFSNMAMLFLGIEIVSISLYIMAGSRRFDVRSNEAGFKYFLLGSFASGFLLLGIALIYGTSGSFIMQQISVYAMSGNVSPLFYLGMLLMIIAMLFKVAAVPFHFWSPDVYEGAPALITTLMSTLVKVAVFAAFYRLILLCFTGSFSYAQDILAIVTAATIILGNVVALSQQNVKRLLAYSGISHAGYMLLTLLSINGGNAAALFFYSTTYSLATLGAFTLAIPVFAAMHSEQVDAFNGLGKKHPLMAAMLTISMLSLAGIPPFAGFLGKYYIFSEAIISGQVTLTLIAIINSIIGVYYYFKLILAMYTKPTNESIPEPTPAFWLVAGVCVAGGIILGIFPNALITLLQ